ncbi:MAG: hypothetical protein LBO62_07815 [Endomicrobium sp.]|jgi:hypothetical protein|nr:hypothetical protein [Endomicrobium sp.]
MKKFFILLSLLAFFSSPAFALFDTSYWGVRALGMGGAYTAVADDADAPGYNIAGIASLKKTEIVFTSARLFAGVDGYDIGTDYLGGVYPLDPKYGAISAGWMFIGDAGVRREDSINIGYARNLDDVIKLISDIDWLSVSAGVNFRYLRWETKSVYVDENTFIGDLSNDAFAFDIGLLLRFKYGISVGYSGRYLNSPDIGHSSEDNVKPTNVLGLAYYSEELPFLKIPKFTAALDYQIRSGDNLLMAGIESRILDGKLALRAGAWEDQINFGLGYGFDFLGSKLTINYAFGLPLGIQSSAGSHFLSINVRLP